jgi:hypothetical protein
MTPDELQILLQGRALRDHLDIKTLVIDLIRQQPPEQIEALFHQLLPTISLEKAKGYIFMQRS